MGMSDVCYNPARRRHPRLFQGVPIGFQLGIDLGGSKLAIAIADPDGRLIAHETRPSRISGDPEADVLAIAADAADLVARSGLATSDFDAAGLSVPGPIDHERGAILDPPNLPGWEDVPLRARMSEILGLPVRIENDANAAALAEWRYGAGRGSHNLVYLTMSTGVGAGLILDGRLYRGHRGRASEFGHACIEWDGERCGCGRRGCLEAYLGGAAWTRRLREITPTTSRVCALAGARGRVLPEHVVAAAGEGDAFARRGDGALQPLPRSRDRRAQLRARSRSRRARDDCDGGGREALFRTRPRVGGRPGLADPLRWDAHPSERPGRQAPVLRGSVCGNSKRSDEGFAS